MKTWIRGRLVAVTLSFTATWPGAGLAAVAQAQPAADEAKSPPAGRYEFGPRGAGMRPVQFVAGGLHVKLSFGKAEAIGNIPLLVEVREARRKPHLISEMTATLGMPTMPEMGTDVYVLSRDPLGQYVSAPLISMGGPWRIDVHIERPGKDALTVPFEVEFPE